MQNYKNSLHKLNADVKRSDTTRGRGREGETGETGRWGDGEMGRKKGNRVCLVLK
jgi:hypothetical protein